MHVQARRIPVQATFTNGVDVERFRETLDVFEADSKAAIFRFKATNEWKHGAHSRTRIDEFEGAGASHTRRYAHVYESDQPPLLLGCGQSANPLEFVLHALAGCMTAAIACHAAAAGITIRSIRSTLEGELDLRGFFGLSQEVRRGFRQVEVAFEIDADVEEHELDELVAMAPRFSPVYDILTRPVPLALRARKAD